MDESQAKCLIEDMFTQSLTAHQRLLDDGSLINQVADLARLCAHELEAGGMIFFAGNGGSFADAQHLAAELTGTMGRRRPALAGLALGTNNSSISAIGNDFGYQFTLSRELEGLARPGSVVVALSTSGNSPNILELAVRARELGVDVVGLTGASGGQLAELCEVIRVPADRTERIQELHILVGHTLCYLIEEFLDACLAPE